LADFSDGRMISSTKAKMPTTHTMRISKLWANGFVDILFAILFFFFVSVAV
jgi:hypothetical protein